MPGATTDDAPGHWPVGHVAAAYGTPGKDDITRYPLTRYPLPAPRYPLPTTEHGRRAG